MASRIMLSGDKIADFCRRNRIRKLALFGSVLRDDFRADSDVDVLVEFEPGARVGFLSFMTWSRNCRIFSADERWT
jgi:predicted nucleotidyltransferase